MARKDLEDWIQQLGDEMHRLSSEMSPGAPKLARQKEWSPRVDVIETSDHVIVRVELAGVKSGQFSILYSGEKHSLTVKGERSDEVAESRVSVAPHQLEVDFGRFAREINLPDVPTAPNDAQAQLCNGMLTVLIPKVQEDRGSSVVIEQTITVRRIL